jgi:hypothetical protein
VAGATKKPGLYRGHPRDIMDERNAGHSAGACEPRRRHPAGCYTGGKTLSLNPPISAGIFATGAAHPRVAACAPVLAHLLVRSGPVLAAPSAELAPARICSA